MISTLAKILGNSTKSVSNWKKEARPIMSLLNKYFTKEELEEFLRTGKIEKFENIKSLESFKLYIQDIHNTLISKSIVDNKVKFSVYLIDTIHKFKLSDTFSNYPDDVFSEYLNFILTRDTEDDYKESLLQILYKINKDTFYMYVSNIELLNNYVFKENSAYVYSNYVK